MKNILLTMAAVCSFGIANAQSEQGGFPLSFSQNDLLTPSTIILETPDFESYLKTQDETKPSSYKVGMFTNAAVSFPNDGVFTTASNGELIWQANISIEDVKSMSLRFNQFEMPQGVKMYAMNKNKKQVLGAFDNSNRREDGMFKVTLVQGEQITIELNIPQGVEINDIKLHIDRATAFFRGFDDLAYFSDDYTDYGTFDATDDWLFGGSSKCMINSKCPQGNGFENQRKATALLIIPAGSTGVGLCSGTMINNTSNTTTNCTQYLLTATHCEGSNSTSAGFNDWDVRFNFEQAICTWMNLTPLAKSYDYGTEFVARDPYDDAAPASDLDADFLLIKLPTKIPTNWDVVMNGWDRNALHTTSYTSPNKFIGFHHPAGSEKKLSISQSITSSPASRWQTIYTEGYGAPGSSGSGWFDNEGELMGIASVATYGYGLPDSCNVTPFGDDASNSSTRVSYAKLSYCWNNPSIPSPTNAQKLQPWLNPANDGTMQLGAVKANTCEPLSAISHVNANSFEGDVNIYPNPSSSGMVQVNVKMKTNLQTMIEVYDISGKKVLAEELPKLDYQIYNLNLSNVANGIYLVKISNESGYITKKAIVNK